MTELWLNRPFVAVPHEVHGAGWARRRERLIAQGTPGELDSSWFDIPSRCFPLVDETSPTHRYRRKL